MTDMSNKTMDFFFVFWNHVVCQQLKFKMIYACVKTKKKHFLPNAKYLKRLVNRIMLVKLFVLER